MKIIYCDNGCCKIKIQPYKNINKKYSNKRNKKKSGSFIFDNSKNKILLVQSRGNLWGPPKGTTKNNEDIKDCAIRETKEETGIKININQLENSYTIKGKSTYYFIEMIEREVDIQKNNNNSANDANGIGWINVDCLKELIYKKDILITSHLKILFKKFLNIKL
tara:strand:- start:1430 stop:1921 length:492 start_codon:yes stop_codon:yes gene_type:complete